MAEKEIESRIWLLMEQIRVVSVILVQEYLLLNSDLDATLLFYPKYLQN